MGLCVGLLILVVLTYPTYSSEKGQTDPATIIKSSEESLNTVNPAQIKDHKIIVYYFHGTSRCATCRKIEKYTIEAVNESFEKELSSGIIQTKVINVEEKENAHFAKDYKLITKSVIISDMTGEVEKRWKNLEKVWELVLDEDVFKGYVVDEIKAYL